MMEGHHPAARIADRYTAQQGYAATHQTCLAHLARNVAYTVGTSEKGSDVVKVLERIGRDMGCPTWSSAPSA